MSDYEKHVGKLKKVDLSEFNDDIEKFFEIEYRKLFTDLTENEIQDAYHHAVDYKYRRNRGHWEYLFFDNCYDYDMSYKFYVVNGNIYETIENKQIDEDCCFLKDNGDGTYDYFMEFYNGGTCLGECIEYELEKLK